MLDRALERNPLFPKNFLTAGDWSLKIWSEDTCVSPLQWVWSGQHRVTSATWSPVRDVVNVIQTIFSFYTNFRVDIKVVNVVFVFKASLIRPSVIFATRDDGYLMVRFLYLNLFLLHL